MEIYLGSQYNNSNLKVKLTTQKTVTEEFKG